MTNLSLIHRATIHRGNTMPVNFAGILGTGVVAWPNYTLNGWF
ncbi:hypothetical protein [Leptolyngbya subtilissima]